MDLNGHCGPSTSSATVAMAAEDSAGFEQNFVTIIAEQLGIDLTLNSAQAVARDVSTQLRNVFKLARKFQRSGRRKWLGTEDVEAALSYFGHSPIIGYEPLDNVAFRHVGKQGRDLFVREDPEVELNQLITSTPPKLPLEPTLKAHWLVINGTQPAIPENPLPATTPSEKLLLAGIDQNRASTSSSLGGGSGLLLNQLAKSVRKTEQVQIKSTTTHALSLEQQVFFLKIMEAIMGQDENKRNEALNCLQTDCGLALLLPRLSIAITEGVRCNIVVHNMAILVYLMRMILALSQNAALSLEPCLHELLPAIMSCILSRQLSSNQQTSETHCVLREFSSDLLAQLLRHYRMPHIHTRVMRVLSRAFTEPGSHSLPTLYGASYALCQLGSEVIQRIVLPQVPTICAAIQRVHSNKLYVHERSLAERFYSKMVEKLTAFAKDPNNDFSLRSHQDFFNCFGAFADDVFKECKNNSNNNTNFNNNNNVGDQLKQPQQMSIGKRVHQLHNNSGNQQRKRSTSRGSAENAAAAP